MSTEDREIPESFPCAPIAPREWQFPMLFVAIVLALWVAMWFGIYLLV